MQKRTTLICTVGTSLLTNIKGLERMENLPQDKQEIYEAYMSGNYEKLAKLLLKLDPKERICGAEINTIEEAKKKKWLDIENIVFLVSDTKDGEITGNLLKSYYSKRKDMNVEVYVEKVEKLQPESPKDFKKYGLRNLIRKIGDITSRSGSENVAIDATGGYKAQIALAVMFGQALGIPVYYKHESFGEIIDFPPMPVLLDYTLYGRYNHIFKKLGRNNVLDSKDFEEIEETDREKMLVFVDSVEEKDGSLHELNAIGELYIEAFHHHIKKNNKKLTPLPDSKRKAPSISQHHFPNHFVEFVNKVWSENKWILTCKDMHYNKQKSIKKGIWFGVYREKEDYYLIGTYKVDEDFGARFKIFLEEKDPDLYSLAAEKLNDEYGTI